MCFVTCVVLFAGKGIDTVVPDAVVPDVLDELQSACLHAGPVSSADASGSVASTVVDTSFFSCFWFVVSS